MTQAQGWKSAEIIGNLSWAAMFVVTIVVLLFGGCSDRADRLIPQPAPPGPFGAPADARGPVSAPRQQQPRQAAAPILNKCLSERCKLECAEGNPNKPRYCLGMIPPTPAETAEAFEQCRADGRC